MKETTTLQTQIMAFLEKKEGANIQEIAQATGLAASSPATRRAIQRALKKLAEQNLVQTQGEARARVYRLNSNLTEKAEQHTFKDIPFTEQSRELLQYLSKPTQTRKIVGYQQEFLRSYQPNQTPYLNASLRAELLSIGRVEHIARPAGTYARNILNRLLIDLSWNSSRLEGNTYSLLETKRLIELGENASGKDITETQMILNHKGAIEYIIDAADEPKISAHDVYSIHALLSEHLLGDASASGRIRNISVGISGTTYLPIDNPHLLKEYFNIFIEKLNQIEDPFEQSFFSLVHLSYLQAFEDVNKRTARLVANIPLIKKNLKPLSFIDVDKEAYVISLLGVYEKNDLSLLRDLYVWAYKRSAQRYSAVQQNISEPNPLKLKYREAIHDIIRAIIINKVPGQQVVSTIKESIKQFKLSEADATQLFQIIESEMMSLHDGNIAKFRVRPSEFEAWKKNKTNH